MEPRVDHGTSHASPKIGDIESPAWQEYFFLAPNVRFTRTPDYKTKKHRQQSDPVVEQGAPDALPTQQAVTQPIVDKAPVAPSLLALPVSVKSRNLETARLQGSSEPAASRTSPLAAASAAPGRANDKARRVPSVPPMTAATGRASVRMAAVPAGSAATKTANPETLRWPHLSDHAFFEVMAPYLVDVSSQARPARPANPALPHQECSGCR